MLPKAGISKAKHSCYPPHWIVYRLTFRAKQTKAALKQNRFTSFTVTMSQQSFDLERMMWKI